MWSGSGGITPFLSPSAAQSGANWNCLSARREPVEEMRGPERRHRVHPTPLEHRLRHPASRTRAESGRSISIAVISKPGMTCPKPCRQTLQHLVVGAALARRIDQLRADLDVAVPAGLVDVVVLHEHRGRQHDVRPARRLGHELLVRADEQIVAGEAAADAVAVGADGQRVLVLDQHGMNLRAVAAVPCGRRSARCRCGSCRARGSTGRAHPGLRSGSVQCTCRGWTTARRRLRAARRR